MKYRLMQFGLLPLSYFIGSYFLKLGFLDGIEGYYFSKFKSHYFLQIQTKIKELENLQSNTSSIFKNQQNQLKIGSNFLFEKK